MKVLLLGITGSGKSTTAKAIAKKLGLRIIEADDEVKVLNRNIWPDDEKVIDKFFQTTTKKVLKLDNILYVISWLNKEAIRAFYEQGFKIVELHADIDELLKRKIKRDNPKDKELRRFKQNYEGYYEVVEDPNVKKMLSVSIDTTNKSPEAVNELVLDSLSN